MAARRALTFSHVVQAKHGSGLLDSARLDVPEITFAVTDFRLQLEHRSADAWLRDELDKQVSCVAGPAPSDVAPGTAQAHLHPRRRCRFSSLFSLSPPVHTPASDPRLAGGPDRVPGAHHPAAR